MAMSPETEVGSCHADKPVQSTGQAKGAVLLLLEGQSGKANGEGNPRARLSGWALALPRLPLQAKGENPGLGRGYSVGC